MKKIYIHFSIFVLFLAIILAFSGCGRKSEPVAENNLTPALSSEEREQAPLPPLQKGEVETATSSSETAEIATSAGKIATSTEDVDTSDWKVYKNEEYGFELRYPRVYTSNSIYAIWETTPEEENIYGKKYKYWRIVKHREGSHAETIIAVEVFLKSKKEEIFKNRSYKLTGKKVLIANNIEAEKVDGYETQLFIERDKFIYFISSFVTPEMKEKDPMYEIEYNEYQSILKTLKIY